MTIRQLVKLLLFLGTCFSMSYGLLKIANGATAILEEVLTSFFVVATLVSAMSIAMFNYLDSIAKDLTELRNEVDRPGYLLTHEKLTALKREVLHNGVLVVFLLIFERCVKGAAAYLLTQLPPENGNLISEISLSLRLAFFSLSLWAATIQIKGFLVAVELRDLIAKNRK